MVNQVDYTKVKKNIVNTIQVRFHINKQNMLNNSGNTYFKKIKRKGPKIYHNFDS